MIRSWQGRAGAASGQPEPDDDATGIVAAGAVVPHVDIAPPLPAVSRAELSCAAIAAVLHFGVYAALTVERPATVGGGGSLIEILAVEIIEIPGVVRLRAGDQRDADRARAEPDDGAAEPSPDAAASRRTDAADLQQPEPAPRDLPAPEGSDADVARALADLRRGQSGAAETEQEAAEAPADDRSGSAGSTASKEGGGLRGADQVELPGVAVAMASGTAQDYAKEVIGVLMKSRPRIFPGARGTVRVVFAVSAGGDPVSVRVKTPSGNAILDEAALAAVREMRFPPPPAGLRSSELLYEVPYIFR